MKTIPSRLNEVLKRDDDLSCKTKILKKADGYTTALVTNGKDEWITTVYDLSKLVSEYKYEKI